MSDGTRSSDSRFAQQLAAARCGSNDDVGELVASFRGYLLAIAGVGLDSALRVKVAPSDLVQETLLQAQQHFGQFRGESSRELLAWLREILPNRLRHARRMYRGSPKRRITLERPLPTQEQNGQIPRVTDPRPTPRTATSRMEESHRLREAIDRLPADYRSAVLFRSWDDLSFEEVGRRMNRSAEAARKLWSRAIQLLHSHLNGGELKSGTPTAPQSLREAAAFASREKPHS